MNNYKRKMFGDHIVMTTWDVAQEVFGNSDVESYKKVKKGFIDALPHFTERTDYFNVPRNAIVSYGQPIQPCFNSTKDFQLYTLSGVNKLLKYLDIEELVGSLDHLFVNESTKKDGEFTIRTMPKTPRILSEEEKEEIENDSVFSEKMLSLISFITMAKAIFDKDKKSVGMIEIGTVIVNNSLATSGALEVITNITHVDDRVLMEFTQIEYNKEEKIWDIVKTHSFIRSYNVALYGLQILSTRGVEFILSLKDENASKKLYESLDEIKSLFGKRVEIQDKINEEFDKLTSLSMDLS